MVSTFRGIVRAAAACAALFLSTSASAVYVFNTVSYPGSVMTDVRGLNGTGRIVGYASVDGVNNFSFSYAGGVFSLLPSSGVTATAHGINDAGVIVGTTFEDPSPSRGFVLSGGAYTFFTRPGWATTYARAISNSGLVTGYSEDGAGASSGYLYNPVTATFTDITVPGSFFTIAQGINNAGQVVGSAVLPGGTQAFLRQPDGTIVLFQIAGNPTRARGITDTGLMTGFVTMGAVTSGFVGNSLGYQLLDVPGSTFTVGEAINNAGQVSGLYYDAAGATRGFIATPVSLPTGTTSGGAYVFSVAVIPGVPIFIDPVVAVGYDYRIGKKNPRIATVRLPIGIGDSWYKLKVGGRKFFLAGGDLFDFRTNGFPKGVEKFRVDCIEVDAMLDPANPQAFPTELSFMDAGWFTGTQKPLTRDSERGDKGKCMASDRHDDDDEDDDDRDDDKGKNGGKDDDKDDGKGKGKGK